MSRRTLLSAAIVAAIAYSASISGAAAHPTLYQRLGGYNAIQAVVDEARRLIFAKGRDAHDYKFSAAILEDSALLSPESRNRLLAASVHYLKGSQAPDNGLTGRIREAMKS